MRHSIGGLEARLRRLEERVRPHGGPDDGIDPEIAAVMRAAGEKWLKDHKVKWRDEWESGVDMPPDMAEAMIIAGLDAQKARHATIDSPGDSHRPSRRTTPWHSNDAPDGSRES